MRIHKRIERKESHVVIWFSHNKNDLFSNTVALYSRFVFIKKIQNKKLLCNVYDYVNQIFDEKYFEIIFPLDEVIDFFSYSPLYIWFIIYWVILLQFSTCYEILNSLHSRWLITFCVFYANMHPQFSNKFADTWV